jgi:hypothetical protein
MTSKFLRRLFYTLAAAAGLITAAAGPASALGNNHCEPLRSTR